MTDRITPSELLSGIVSEAEAAPMLSVKTQTLRVWRTRGKGPPYLKFSRKVRYRLSDLLAFIEASRVVPGAKKTRRKRRK